MKIMVGGMIMDLQRPFIIRSFDWNFVAPLKTKVHVIKSRLLLLLLLLCSRRRRR